MPLLLFKYVEEEGVAKIFKNEDSISLRFSRLHELNDPYELFLQTDKPLDSELRAFYKYFLGKLDNFPILCLSRRPDSIVMWTHYSKARAGVCLGFDEDELTKAFPVIAARDVEYSEHPANIPSDLVAHAATTMKARHAEWLLNAAHSAAYFTKRKDWEYEAERRMVANENALRATGDGILLADVPFSALHYIIIGDRASQGTNDLCSAVGRSHKIPVFKLRVGRASYQPYFERVDGRGSIVWDGSDFAFPDSECNGCGEPTSDVNDEGNCTFCGVSDEEAADAARGNQLLLAIQYGLKDGVEINLDADVKGTNASEPSE